VCTYVGHLYDEGKGMPANEEKAADNYGYACYHGVAESCLLLGERLAVGDRVKKDDVRAASMFNEGCRLTDVQSCLQLGAVCKAFRKNSNRSSAYAAHCLPTGGLQRVSVGSDLAAAYEAACDAGHAELCYRAAYLYAPRDRRPGEPERYRALRKRACDGGVAEACKEDESTEVLPADAPTSKAGGVSLRRVGLIVGIPLVALALMLGVFIRRWRRP
jgi:uncharacterized protein